MKRFFLSCAFVLLLLPLQAHAEVYERWLFESEADVDMWRAVGVEEATLLEENLVFAASGTVTLYRELPEAFREEVDAIRVDGSWEGLEQVELQLLETDEAGKDIRRRFRLELALHEQDVGGYAYVPLSLYWNSIPRANFFALQVVGAADEVRFGGVHFYHYTPLEKLIGAWSSFWTLQPFGPSTINIIVGPVILPDIGPLENLGEVFSRSISVNAYLLVGLSLLGIAMLFVALWLARTKGVKWEVQRPRILTMFFVCIAVVWLLYDYRMGVEFLGGVLRDHVQYISVPASERTFRDRDRFYDFAAFVPPLVADSERYELMLPEMWPYLGSMQYITYPTLPNREVEPVSGTWVIYDRPDIAVSDDGRLMREGEAFTQPGSVLGYFGPGSFVFRES